jgi:ABC-type branched-subunit amino acid transport system ATPase component
MNVPGSVRLKLLLARAIVGSPKLVILSGYFGGFEPAEEKAIADMLMNPKKNWTLVISTDNRYMASLADRIYILDAGQLVLENTFDQIKNTEHFKNVFGTQTI